MNKLETLKAALAGREQEIAEYQINIDNFALAIAKIQKEHEIAVNKQRNTLLRHQNQLLYYMICAIEAQSSSNPNFIGSNAIKARKILDESLIYD